MAATRPLKKILKEVGASPVGSPPEKTAILTLTKNDIDLIFDMIAIDEAVVQPFLKMLNAPNQNLRRAHVAALKVRLEQILQFAKG